MNAATPLLIVQDLHQSLTELTKIIGEAVSHLERGERNAALGALLPFEDMVREAGTLCTAAQVLLRR